MTYQHLTFNVTGHIAHVRLNRPPVNALNRRLVSELTSLANDLQGMAKVWIVELSATGKTFCAGADLKERATIPDAKVGEVVGKIQAMTYAWMQVPQPVVVGIQGAALGGGLELALAGDLLVASDEAVLGFPEVSLGIIPAAGGTQRLAHRTSLGIAKRWVLTAQQFSAREAWADSVVDVVVPAAAFEVEFAAYVERLSRNAPLSLRQAKAALNKSFDDSLKSGLKSELKLYYPLIKTHDRKEALDAFAKKREPEWRGN